MVLHIGMIYNTTTDEMDVRTIFSSKIVHYNPDSKEAAANDVDNLDFDNENDIPAEDKKPDLALVEIFTRTTLRAATGIQQFLALTSLDVHRKDEVASPKSKAQVTKVDSTTKKEDSPQEEPVLKGWALARTTSKERRINKQTEKPIVKDVESMKGSSKRESTRGEGDNTDGAILQAANILLEASKMQVDSVLIATLVGPSTKPARKHHQASPLKVDVPAIDIKEASTQVSSNNMFGPLKSPLKL